MGIYSTNFFRDFFSPCVSRNEARILPHVVLQRSGRALQSYGINTVRLHHFVPGESCQHDGHPDVFSILVLFGFLSILPRLLLRGLDAKDGTKRERHLDLKTCFFLMHFFKPKLSACMVWVAFDGAFWGGYFEGFARTTSRRETSRNHCGRGGNLRDSLIWLNQNYGSLAMEKTGFTSMLGGVIFQVFLW